MTARALLVLLSVGGACSALVASSATARPAAKAGVETIMVELKDHRFMPAEIKVPAGQRVRFEVVNRDATADDFDSDDLHVDKDIAPHGKVAFTVGPLKPGVYAFKAELHADTAHGTVTAADPAS